METSFESEPEHYSCILVCREQQWSTMSLYALQGLIEYRGSSPLKAPLWMFPIHPASRLPQLSDPGPESSTVILLTDLNCRSHSKLQRDKHTVTSVVICIELLVIIRPAPTFRQITFFFQHRLTRATKPTLH